MQRTATWSLLLAMLALGGCKGEWSPDSAYRKFANAVANHDGDKAFAMLSEASRKKVTLLAEQAAKAGGTVLADPRRMILAGDPYAKSIQSVNVVRSEGGVAVLSVDDGSGPREVTMVREGLRWKVQL